MLFNTVSASTGPSDAVSNKAPAPKSIEAQKSNPKRMSVGHLPDPFNDGSAFGGGFSSPADNKKYYDLGNLKTLDDYLGDPFLSPKSIFSVTTSDKKVYTLVPYANAAASPNVTYIDTSLVWETGLGYAATKYAPQVGKFMLKSAPLVGWSLATIDVGNKLADTYRFMQENHPSLLTDPSTYSMGGGPLLKEAAEFVWEGTKTLAQRVFYPETLIGPTALSPSITQTFTQDEINTQKNIGRIAAVASINEGTCVQMADWTPLQKTQFLVDQSEMFGRMIDPSLQARLDGTEKHQILREMIRETQDTCGNLGLASEIPVLNGRIYFTGRPLSMEGASIVDVITRQEINEQYHTFDAKFGKAGITYASMMKLVKNMGNYKFMLYEVRPQSNWWIYGPTKLKYPNFSFTTKYV